MIPLIDTLYEQIGQHLPTLADKPWARLHVRVEMAADFGSVGVFVDRGGDAFEQVPDSAGRLFELFAALRRAYVQAGVGAWSQATLTLQPDGRFEIDFGHEPLPNVQMAAARRKSWISRVLGPHARVSG